MKTLKTFLASTRPIAGAAKRFTPWEQAPVELADGKEEAGVGGEKHSQGVWP